MGLRAGDFCHALSFYFFRAVRLLSRRTLLRGLRPAFGVGLRGPGATDRLDRAAVARAAGKFAFRAAIFPRAGGRGQNNSRGLDGPRTRRAALRAIARRAHGSRRAHLPHLRQFSLDEFLRAAFLDGLRGDSDAHSEWRIGKIVAALRLRGGRGTFDQAVDAVFRHRRVYRTLAHSRAPRIREKMDLARRRHLVSNFSAEPDLGNTQRLSDHRAAARGDRHEIRHADAVAVHLAASSADASARRADLPRGPVVFISRSRARGRQRPLRKVSREFTRRSAGPTSLSSWK